MSLIKSTNVGSSEDGPFYNDVATTSLRCDAGSNPKLVANGISGNRKTWTWSCWVKRSSLGSAHIVFNVGVTGTDEIDFHFTAADQFIISDRGGHNLKTTQLFRDTSAWYNLVVVMDTVQSGVTFDSANALKLYVNGVRVTSFASGTSLPDENDVFSVNHTRIHHIATRNLDDNDFAGYLAEMNLIDGIAIGETNGYLDEFGKLKNGVWVPKDTSGLTFGNNGFRLQFKENAVGTGGDATIGADTSGKNHDFTSSGITVSDCAMPDSPENNFCTLNPLANNNFGSAHAAVHTEGSLKAVASGTSASHFYGTFRINDFLTKGCYFEARIIRLDPSRFYFGAIDPLSYTGAAVASYQNTQKAVMNQQNRIFSNANTGGVVTFAPNSMVGGEIIKNNDIVGVAIKGDNVWFHVNGSYTKDASNTVGNPSSGANPAIPAITAIATTDYFPYFGYASDYHVNFGQDPGFAGFLSDDDVGTETADEGAGVFKYDVPTGFQAMCSANLPEPDIGPNSGAGEQATDYFGVLTYTGNDAANRAIVSGGTGIGGEISFKPDWLWHKARDVTNFHFLFDSTRGVDKRLSTNSADGEGDASGLDSFDVGGFTVDHEASAQDMNASAHTYVAWNWKANGGTTTTNDASSTSVGTIDSVFQASTESGFSIVRYTATGSAGTIKHGLSVVPDFMIIKHLDADGTGWIVYYGDNTDALSLQNSNATDDNTYFNDTSPTDTVFSVGGDGVDTNNSGAGSTIAYVFHAVEGYSQFGRYNGVGGTNGTFVYTGFRPAWPLIKRTDSTNNWHIFDTTRGTFNEMGSGSLILADLTNTEASLGANMDILSNGFKTRANSGGYNVSGGLFIYMAFAEAPFKYANAR